ncbi:DUF4416 family protein [bacterium]|nr:DUF4416 family protein [bacterium]
MAVIQGVQPVRPVCAITFSPEMDLENIIEILEPVLGVPDARSAIYNFDFTAYYEPEMGSGLKKVFLAFAGLIQPSRLAYIKNMTNHLEADKAIDGKRCINLDPAYISLAKLVVASAKDFAHRIYIGQGIYGDLQLQFKHGCFHPQPWTFPDYQSKDSLDFFKIIRNELLNRI